MQKRTEIQIKKEKDSKKVEKVVEKKCLSSELSEGKVLHHVKRREARKTMVPSIIPTNRVKKRK